MSKLMRPSVSPENRAERLTSPSDTIKVAHNGRFELSAGAVASGHIGQVVFIVNQYK
jgi:hypothetical protein